MAAQKHRLAARCLALLWFGFWSWFSFAEGLEGLSHLPMVLIMGFSVWAAWKWEVTGGILLALEGLFVMIAYPLTVGSRFPVGTIIFVLATLGLPPLLAGILFIFSGSRRSAPGPA